MRRHVKVHIPVHLTAECAAHLLWNCLLRGDSAEDATVKLAEHAPSLGLVRELVRKEIADRGTFSVDCGPSEDYYDPAVERLILDLVRRAFKF